MSKRPRCDENLISFEEASARLLKLAKQHKRTLKAKNVLEESNKWRQNGNVEKEILRELEVDRQKRMKLTEILCCDTECNPEQTLRARLTDQYYEPIESQIMAITTFHSRTILAQKVFDKISTENVVNLVTWLISKPSKHDALRRLNFSFDTTYWKQRINPVRQSSYLFEQIEQSKEVDILEFTSQIVQHQHIIRGKSVEVVQCKNVQIYTNSEGQIYYMGSPMMGHQTVLFNNKNECNCSFEERDKIPIYMAEIGKAIPDFSNPIETGYCNGDNIILFEPFVIKIAKEYQSE